MVVHTIQVAHGSFFIAGGPLPGAFAFVGTRDAVLRVNGAVAVVRTALPECDVEVDVRIEVAEAPAPSGEWTRRGQASIECPSRRVTIARGAGGEYEVDAPAATSLIRSNGVEADGVERFLISIRPAAMTEAQARQEKLRQLAARRAPVRPVPPPHASTPPGTIRVEYHQFDIIDPALLMEGYDVGDFHSDVAIVAVTDDLVHVRTSVAMGRLPVAIELLDAPPGDPADDWEDVAEASVRLPSGRVAVRGFDGGPEFALGAPSARVRVHASGRDAQWDLIVDENTIERYLVQLWPADSAPAVTLRARSGLAQRELAAGK